MANTQYFKFTDENEWRTAAIEAGVLTIVNTGTEEEPNNADIFNYYTLDWSVDVVGTISEGGELDSEGNVITEPTVLQGFHVNAKWHKDLPPLMASALIPKPATPHRIFAGD